LRGGEITVMYKRKVWKGVLVFFVISLIIGMAMPSYAANCGDKLRRGLANFATGWVEIPVSMDKSIKESNPAFGVFVGAIKGTVKGLVRTAAGVYDTITFPIPPYDKTWVDPELIVK